MANNDTHTPEHVLIVEDDEGLCELLADEIRDAGLTATTARSAEEARACLDAVVPDLIVSDLRLPGADGMALLAFVRTLPHPPAFIVITAFGTIPQAVEALKAGADDFLTKPLNLDHFVLAVSRSLERQRLRQRVERFQSFLGEEHFHGIVGRSAGMRRLFSHVTTVARGSGPVLITGESGVGKELVARALHEESARARRPFLAVNCAGVPHELLESEFFGYVKGAFTGATQDRKGLFAEADGGTLFLDEIAEMSQALQAKLLRVLQEGMIRSVGSNREVPVDVRVVAATNRDLEEEMAAGRFRTDLYYRLETFQLRVPPLRERGEDLDLLAAYFVERFSLRLGRDVRGFTPEALRTLHAYDFPGNVRELENAIERAVTFASGTLIEPEDLPERIRQASPGRVSDQQADAVLRALVGDDERLPTLSELEERYLHYVLDRVGGNKRRAAALLDIGRRTLYRRLEESGDGGAGRR